MSPHNRLPIDEITQTLRTNTVGHSIEYYPKLDSTMSVAHALAQRADVVSGVIVVANEQTRGRGRVQRTWDAPPDLALLTSIVLKPPHLPAEPGALAMLAGLATLFAIEMLAVTDKTGVGLKWPNDVLIGHDTLTAAKVAGILIESSFQAERMDYAIIGMGINVNQTEAELPSIAPPAPPATSLRLAAGRPINRSDVLIAYCQAWSELLRQPQSAVFANWRSRLWTLGRSVSIHSADLPLLQGTAIDVQTDGSLIVEDRNNKRHTIAAGDVSLRSADE